MRRYANDGKKYKINDNNLETSTTDMLRLLSFLLLLFVFAVPVYAQSSGSIGIATVNADLFGLSFLSDPLFAQVTLDNEWWGPGGYISILKLLAHVFLFFCWVFSLNWANCDSERRKDPTYAKWNCTMFFMFVVPYPLVFNLAPFFVGFPVMLLLWLIPLIVYIKHRNKGIPPHEKVMTPSHIKYLFAVFLSKFGVKVKLKKPMTYEEGPPLQLEATGKLIDPHELQGRTILSRNHPGFNELRNILFVALNSKAESIMLEYGPEEMVTKHEIDGFWHALPPIPRENADPILESMKLLIGGNPEEHRARQAGSFTAILRKKSRFDADFIVQGTPEGERGLFHFVLKKIPFDTLDQLGMRSELQTKIKELVNMNSGLVVFSAPPANGLKSMMNIVARTADRFTRDFATVEDEMNPYQEIENVNVNKYNSAKGETPMNVLVDVFFREPQVLLIRDLINKETLELCCKEIEDNHRLIITTIRARNGAEALLRLLAMKVDPKLFASTISAVVVGRLIRKLCPQCKEAFQPSPQLMQRMGIPAGKVTEFFRVRSPPEEGEKREVCPKCNDIGYVGRTSLFDVLEVNDEIRQILVTNPSLEAIQQAAMKSGQKGFFLEGAVLVAKGITSVDELSRVMQL